MIEGKNIFEIINNTGFAIYLLLFCSVLSIGIMINRIWIFYIKAKKKRILFMEEFEAKINASGRDGAIVFCESDQNSFYAKVAGAALKNSERGEREIESAMDRAIAIEVIDLEKYTAIVGTIGNIALYIGLFGTVIGIMRAFHDIASIGQEGLSVIVRSVSEALIATAAGLGVAVPAVTAYNFFVKKIEYYVKEMQLCASEVIDLIRRK